MRHSKKFQKIKIKKYTKLVLNFETEHDQVRSQIKVSNPPLNLSTKKHKK